MYDKYMIDDICTIVFGFNKYYSKYDGIVIMTSLINSSNNF